MRAHRRTHVLSAALLVTAVAGCAPVPTSLVHAPSLRAATAAARPHGVTEHVVVVSIDGLRPDAIRAMGARTIQRLMREGSHSLEARTILPSITLPSHTSMLTGVEPEEHGITWNNNRTHSHGTVEIPTIFARARAAGLRAAAFFSKGKFNHLIVPGTVDFAQAPEGNDFWFAGRTAENVERYLAAAAPNLLFVHIGEPDYMGHVFGWMGTSYGWAVRRADRAVNDILEASDAAFGAGNYTVILTADHGGHGRTHGTDDPRDVTIPWVAWGKGVRSGTSLPAGIHTTDTAATALWLLGVRPPDELLGRPVTSAFTGPGGAPRTVAASAAAAR